MKVEVARTKAKNLHSGHKKTWDSGAKSRLSSFNQIYKCGVCHKEFEVRSGLIQHIESTGHKKGWKKSTDPDSDPDFKMENPRLSTVTGLPDEGAMKMMIDLLLKMGIYQNAAVESLPGISTEQPTKGALREGEQTTPTDTETETVSSPLQSMMVEIHEAFTAGATPRQKSTDEDSIKIKAHFKCNSSPRGTVTFHRTGVALADSNNADCFKECTLLGHRIFYVDEDNEGSDDNNDGSKNEEAKSPRFYDHNGSTDKEEHSSNDEDEDEDEDEIYLNTHEPFCMVTVGVQGAGKSHTTAAALEGCLIQHDILSDVIKLRKPMTALVLHYNSNPTTNCEATGLGSTESSLANLLGEKSQGLRVAADKMSVLVSPNNYTKRKAFYGNHCTVRPLLFKWKSLTADHIRTIMGLKHDDNQLYINTLMAILSSYQRANRVPSYEQFKKQVMSSCDVAGQGGPLRQRMDMLDGFIAESERNKGLLDICGDLYSTCLPGHLVVCDLTDPLLPISAINGVFQIIVEQYRTLPNITETGGRVLVVDEAHKFMDGASKDGLSAAIVNCARLMRHDGMRLIISTQSPKVLAPELLELVTVAVMHRFHSSDWFSYLESKLPLLPPSFHRIMDLSPGQALVFTSTHMIPTPPNSHDEKCGRNVFFVQIRRRVTADIGQSVVNRKKIL